MMKRVYFKNHKANKGFTLIETAMVIVILAVIITIAAAKFIDIRKDAEEAAADAILGAVKEGINIYHMGELVK